MNGAEKYRMPHKHNNGAAMVGGGAETLKIQVRKIGETSTREPRHS